MSKKFIPVITSKKAEQHLAHIKNHHSELINELKIHLDRIANEKVNNEQKKKEENEIKMKMQMEKEKIMREHELKLKEHALKEKELALKEKAFNEE